MRLTIGEVLAGYDAVSQLYPLVPPICIWRAWEYAAYRRYELASPVLDVGCGDGAFFGLVWPGVHDVVGIEADSGVADAARRSGRYLEVLQVRADQVELPRENFAAVFANCSLEHMDNISEVLRRLSNSLQTSGLFLASVVTDRLLKWLSIRSILEVAGYGDAAKALTQKYIDFHHLENPLSPESWISELENNGLEVAEVIPIVPQVTTRLFLLLDQLWHLDLHEHELGSELQEYIQRVQGFPGAFRKVIEGALLIERDWDNCSGVVLCARKK